MVHWLLLLRLRTNGMRPPPLPSGKLFAPTSAATLPALELCTSLCIRLCLFLVRLRLCICFSLALAPSTFGSLDQLQFALSTRTSLFAGIVPFTENKPLTRLQWSSLLATLSGLSVFVAGALQPDARRFVQGLLRETRVIDALCALLRFPFECTESEFASLTPQLPLTAALKLVYR